MSATDRGQAVGMFTFSLGWCVGAVFVSGSPLTGWDVAFLFVGILVSGLLSRAFVR